MMPRCNSVSLENILQKESMFYFDLVTTAVTYIFSDLRPYRKQFFSAMSCTEIHWIMSSTQTHEEVICVYV